MKPIQPVKPRRRPRALEGVADPDKAVEMTYHEMRGIAASLFRGERVDHTLQPTALVHEAYLRLAKDGPPKYANRAHFFGIVVRTMRRILVEHARRHNSLKHGGMVPKVSIHEIEIASTEGIDFLVLDAALDRLGRVDPQLARLAELRLFGGLTTKQTAVLIRRAESTTRRDWNLAKAWLRRELEAGISMTSAN